MSGLYCPHCQQFIPIFKTGGGEKMALEMGVPFLGSLPFDPAVVEGGDLGKPIMETHPDHPFVKAVDKIASSVVEVLESFTPKTKSAH
jgi:Flp pilus assembly CpaE family ATPase